MSPHVPTWMVQYLVTEFTLTPTPVTPALPLSVLLPFFHVFFFYPTTKPCCDKSSSTMNTLCSLATENPAVSYSFLYTCSCVNPLFLPSLLRLSCSYSPSSPSCSLISDSMNSTPTLSFFSFFYEPPPSPPSFPIPSASIPRYRCFIFTPVSFSFYPSSPSPPFRILAFSTSTRPFLVLFPVIFNHVTESMSSLCVSVFLRLIPFN